MDMAYTVGMLILALALIHKIITLTQAAVILVIITAVAAGVVNYTRKRRKEHEKIDGEE